MAASNGTAVGSTSYFGVYPEYGLVVSLMMNKGQENVDALAIEANRLVELFVAGKLRPAQPGDVAMAPGAFSERPDLPADWREKSIL